MSFDTGAIRRQFRILDQTIDGRPLIYLDNAATTQKPETVLEAMDDFYRTSNANAHRGMHVLAERATITFEGARASVRQFIGAARSEEIVFTKSCTEAINIVAKSWGRAHLKKGDAVVLSILEHHSNIVPWLQLKEEIGIAIEWIDINDDGNVKTDMLGHFLAKGNVKLVAITAQSNVLGTRPPLQEIIERSHAAGALVLIDAAQAIAHGPISVAETSNPQPATSNESRCFDADFLAFSGHKLYGPTGIGILYGKRSLLQSMPPLLGGGMMIQEVTTDRFTTADIPQKFEGGTQPIAEAVGLRAAIDWLQQFSWEDIQSHERSVLNIAVEELSKIDGLQILGPLHNSQFSILSSQFFSGCIAFTLEGVHPHDLTEILGRQGICLRAGHHCTQPLHKRLGINASARLSVGIYNTEDEIRETAKEIRAAAERLR